MRIRQFITLLLVISLLAFAPPGTNAQLQIEPIFSINGNEEFITIASEQGWSGTGTQNDPYVISDLTETELDRGYFSISDTTLYILIANSSFTMASQIDELYEDDSAINLRNVTNVAIINVDIVNFGNGIFVTSSDNVNITDSNLQSRTNYNPDFNLPTGIRSISNNNSLISNNVIDFFITPFELELGNNTDIVSNSMEGDLIISQSSNTLLEGNEIFTGIYDIDFLSIETLTETDNFVDNYPLDVFSNQSGFSLTTQFGQIYIYNSSSIELTATEPIVGISKPISISQSSYIFLNDFSYELESIDETSELMKIDESEFIEIENFRGENFYSGIAIISTTNSFIHNATVNLSGASGTKAVSLSQTTDTTVQNSTLANGGIGVQIRFSSYNLIQYNIIKEFNTGFSIDQSHNNSVVYNVLVDVGNDIIDLGDDNEYIPGEWLDDSNQNPDPDNNETESENSNSDDSILSVQFWSIGILSIGMLVISRKEIIRD